MQYNSHVIAYHYFWLVMAACGRSSFDDYNHHYNAAKKAEIEQLRNLFQNVKDI